MKKNILWLFALLMPFLLGGCSNDEEIVFDHELPQFELRDGKILLEVLVPQSTKANDELFISGAFNGGDDEAVLGKPEYQLMKAENNDVKWGVYLDPSAFAGGKTLADGFHFISKREGAERTVFGKDSVHTVNPSPGTRTNVSVSYWAKFFEKETEPEEVKHDGCAVFIEDNSGWDVTTLYVWGDAEIFGGWPGAQPTGTQIVNGVKYKYYDFGADNAGKTVNLIFNNNGGGKQFDAPQGFVIDHDIYLKITATGYEEVGVTPAVKHDGYAIFVADNTGWDAVAMYAWGDGLPELFGGWPGIQPTGEVTLDGVKYKYFDTGEANKGLKYNLILNNNNGGKQFDVAGITLDRDYYYNCSESGAQEVTSSAKKNRYVFK